MDHTKKEVGWNPSDDEKRARQEANWGKKQIIIIIIIIEDMEEVVQYCAMMQIHNGYG